MRSSIRGATISRRGATLVLVAVCLVGIMAAMALVIDLAMLFDRKSDAQRVADAASLAGASSFLEPASSTAQKLTARDRAVEYLIKNTVGREVVDVGDSSTVSIGADLYFSSREAEVRVIPAEYKVRVRVRRANNTTWFARLFGRDAMPVAAKAAAEAVNAGAAKCLKPVALPDMWDEGTGDTSPHNREYDQGETWGFNGTAGGDRYERYTPGSTSATGYGGSWRNPYSNIVDDYGRQVTLKYQGKPADQINLPPSFYLTWDMPRDPNVKNCKNDNTGGDKGLQDILANICHCNTTPVRLFDSVSYKTKPGLSPVPIEKQFRDLISDKDEGDPGASWDPVKKTVVGSKYGENWLESPRVVKVALFSPDQLTDKNILNGSKSIVFNNFGLMFLDSVPKSTGKPPEDGSGQNITAHFLRYVSGEENTGPATGSLVKYLHLVE